MLNIGVFYVAVINLAAFAMFGYDKRQAKKNGWRVPERTLLALAAAFGSIGAYIGMHGFRHKTRHWKFRIGIPVMVLVQCMAVGAVLMN